jgi:hypothetical protein
MRKRPRVLRKDRSETHSQAANGHQYRWVVGDQAHSGRLLLSKLRQDGTHLGFRGLVMLEFDNGKQTLKKDIVF